MTKLFQNPDGADEQARAVLAYLSAYDGIEGSWNDARFAYDAEPTVDRWNNCREQGYVICLRSKNMSRQLNIAFFEHRNSDSICAVEWEQLTINPPTIDNMDCPSYLNDKYAVSHKELHGSAHPMAEWIYRRLCGFWAMTNK